MVMGKINVRFNILCVHTMQSLQNGTYVYNDDDESGYTLVLSSAITSMQCCAYDAFLEQRLSYMLKIKRLQS